MVLITKFSIIYVLILVQNVVYIHCKHAKVDTAELLSKEMLKKLNQTGIDKNIEMMSVKSKTASSPNNITVHSNATSIKYINDFTNFVTHLNDWVILGQWARYHLTFFTGNIPIPKIPSSVDQSVLICTVTKFPSSLTKEFVGLTDSFLTLVHYVSFENDISIEGLISSNNTTEVFFTLNKDDLYERNNNWIINTFRIPNHIKAMTVILQPRSSDDAKWAIGSIMVNGTETPRKSSPVMHPTVKETTKGTTNTTTTTAKTTPAPLTTSPNITKSHNVTTFKPIDNSTALPLVNLTSSSAKELSKNDDPLKDISGIANAIWDAFYVFLALFCACMIALVVLIVRQR